MYLITKLLENSLEAYASVGGSFEFLMPLTAHILAGT